MLTHTLRVLLIAALLLPLLPAGASAAGGGGVPQGASTAGDSAASAYNRGLKSRDKAWAVRDQMAAASGIEREKLRKKMNKEYEKAIRAYRSAIKLDPQMYQAHSSLGYALRKTGQFEESLVAYDTALGIRPSYAEAIEYRAEAYLGLNRIEEAKEAYMVLFRADRERADELMVAMGEWVEDRQEDPRQMSASAVEEFAGWVRERGGLAKQTASLGGAAGSSWD
jgi:tetratricopeptide (TPR) repeat protein